MENAYVVVAVLAIISSLFSITVWRRVKKEFELTRLGEGKKELFFRAKKRAEELEAEVAKTKLGRWNGAVMLHFADFGKMLLEPDTDGSDSQNIERVVAFPAPLVGLQFCGARKYLPLVSSLSISLKERQLMKANFHVETCWTDTSRLTGQFVQNEEPRVTFEEQVSINDGLYLQVNDGITGKYFWACVEPCLVKGSTRRLRFGFRD